jgi:hypothetical protein
MSLLFTRRLIAALAVSIALHAGLFMLFGTVRVIQSSGGQDVLRVKLSLPVQASQPADTVAFNTPHAMSGVKAFPAANSVPGLIHVLPLEDRFFQYDEVDKRADFINSEPMFNLEQIFPSDAVFRIKVKVLINELGMVNSVTVLEAVPINIYDEKIVSALLHSRFSPAERDGRKVKSQKILELKFGAQ